MSISISGSSSNVATTTNSSQNSKINTLTKEKEDIESQIEELQSGDVTSETTQSQIEQLQAELTNIEAQISQAEAQQTQGSASTTSTKSTQKTKEESVSVKDGFNNTAAQTSAKSKLKDNSASLENEIKFDQTRGLDTTKKEETLSNMKENIKNINSNTDEEETSDTSTEYDTNVTGNLLNVQA